MTCIHKYKHIKKIRMEAKAYLLLLLMLQLTQGMCNECDAANIRDMGHDNIRRDVFNHLGGNNKVSSESHLSKLGILDAVIQLIRLRWLGHKECSIHVGPGKETFLSIKL